MVSDCPGAEPRDTPPDLAIGNLTYAGAVTASASAAAMALNLGGATLPFPRQRLHLNWASPNPDHGLPNHYRGHANMKQMRSSLKRKQ